MWYKNFYPEFRKKIVNFPTVAQNAFFLKQNIWDENESFISIIDAWIIVLHNRSIFWMNLLLFTKLNHTNFGIKPFNPLSSGPLFQKNSQINRVTNFSGTFRQTESDSESDSDQNKSNPFAFTTSDQWNFQRRLPCSLVWLYWIVRYNWEVYCCILREL